MVELKRKSHITHVITDLGDGGAQSSLFALCKHATLCSHSVISLRDMGKYGVLLSDIGVSVECLDLPKGRVTVRGIKKLAKLLSENKSTTVQCWMYHANLLASIALLFQTSKRVVWGIHHTNLKPSETSITTRSVAKLGAYLSYFSPSTIICCAEAARKTHSKYGYNKRRMVVIPNGYDLKTLQPNATSGMIFREQHGIHATQSLIGFVARLNPQKDHLNLIKAVSLLKARGVSVICALAGTGLEPKTSPLRDTIQKLALEENIKLLGPVEDIPALMNALDIHVMSSSFGEAFPNVLSEAMACGTICVTTDVGDASFIVGETGKVVAPQEPEHLAAAIESLLILKQADDKSEWLALQHRARARIQENFSIERVCQRHYEVWFS